MKPLIRGEYVFFRYPKGHRMRAVVERRFNKVVRSVIESDLDVLTIEKISSEPHITRLNFTIFKN